MFLQATKLLLRLCRRFVLAFGLAAVLLGAGIPDVKAQDSAPGWSLPTNLSESGSSSMPVLRPGTDGKLYAFWADTFTGYRYRRGDGNNWESAQRVGFTFPIDVIQLDFQFSADGRLYALWIDRQQMLHTASAAADAIDNPGAWSSAIPLDSGIAGFQATSDESGYIHLAYLRFESSETALAGVYYTQLVPGQDQWSPANHLFQSPYFRAITPEAAHLTITTATQEGRTHVYVAWDLRLRERILWAHSGDGGNSWEPAAELVGPSLEFGFDLPYQIEFIASASQVMALWQLGVPGDHCTQYYQWTNDQGKTWQAPQMLFETQAGCPAVNLMIPGKQDEIILFTRLNRQVYLLAWDKTQWSLAQPQPDLVNHVDPETNRLINFQAERLLTRDGKIFCIGWDAGGSDDIWVVSRTLQDTASWFPLPSAWNRPTAIASTNEALISAQLVADSTGMFHAFWGQTTTEAGEVRTIIQYAIGDGDSWSLPVEILRNAGHSVYLHSVTINAEDTLFVAWESKNQRGVSDGLFVSWANSQEAASNTAWVTTETFPDLRGYATAPEIGITNNGDPYLVYAVPYHEHRGIYLLVSSENGKKWSEPKMVADATLLESGIVGSPHLASTASGVFMVLWNVYTLPPDPLPLGLYASLSQDYGNSWSEPEAISEEAILWSRAIAWGDSGLQRLWQEKANDVQYVWYQYSTDNGTNWSAADNLLTTSETIQAATMVTDSAGGQHLLMITAAAENKRHHLRHWNWKDEAWVEDKGILLATDSMIVPESLSGRLTVNGSLGLAYIEKLTQPDRGVQFYELRFTRRPYDLAFVEATRSPEKAATVPAAPVLTLTPSPAPSRPPQDTATPSPAASPTPQANKIPSAAQPSPIDWRIPAIIAGGILVVSIVILVVVFGWMRKR